MQLMLIKATAYLSNLSNVPLEGSVYLQSASAVKEWRLIDLAQRSALNNNKQVAPLPAFVSTTGWLDLMESCSNCWFVAEAPKRKHAPLIHSKWSAFEPKQDTMIRNLKKIAASRNSSPSTHLNLTPRRWFLLYKTKLWEGELLGELRLFLPFNCCCI